MLENNGFFVCVLGTGYFSIRKDLFPVDFHYWLPWGKSQFILTKHFLKMSTRWFSKGSHSVSKRQLGMLGAAVLVFRMTGWGRVLLNVMPRQVRDTKCPARHSAIEHSNDKLYGAFLNVCFHFKMVVNRCLYSTLAHFMVLKMSHRAKPYFN